jgi:hypothetical protein
MIRFLKEKKEDFLKCPKKYLTLLGCVLVNIGMCIKPLNSSNAPYYLSYLQIKSNSSLARYPNITYNSNSEMVVISLTAIIAGLLKNKFSFSFKQMYYVGLVFYV